MSIFEHLASLRRFEKLHLPFLATIEDFDIVSVIGFHQHLGKPLLLKQLYLEGIGSVATVTRRLGRLRLAGKVLATPHASDRRNVHLTLSPEVHKLFSRYGHLLAAAAV